ncbi:polyphosphate--glucose phosphotransferase [Corynebacterium sp. CMW7794]|nr:polyphosphate--glucose phosphotransferase [Corynebacterium sp. CMW7794]
MLALMTEKSLPANAGFGIDVGGSGIKGAIVDLDTGEFVGERHKIATPQPATPEAVAETITAIIEHFRWDGPVGITLPSVMKHQVARSAANVDQQWIGTDTQELFGRHLPGREVTVLNDADAAGLAEVEFGAAEAREGAAIFLTLGTGIGSAFLLEGKLFPNTELGHMIVGKKEAEKQASSAVKDKKELSYKDWAKRVNTVLEEYEKLFNPDVFLIGGGISRKFDKWSGYLTLETPVMPANLRNRAGIVGAALAAQRGVKP